MSIDVPGMKAERVEGTAAARQVEEPDFWPLARLLSLPTLARPPPSPPSWDSASSPPGLVPLVRGLGRSPSLLTGCSPG